MHVLFRTVLVNRFVAAKNSASLVEFSVQCFPRGPTREPKTIYLAAPPMILSRPGTAVKKNTHERHHITTPPFGNLRPLTATTREHLDKILRPWAENVINEMEMHQEAKDATEIGSFRDAPSDDEENIAPAWFHHEILRIEPERTGLDTCEDRVWLMQPPDWATQIDASQTVIPSEQLSRSKQTIQSAFDGCLIAGCAEAIKHDMFSPISADIVRRCIAKACSEQIVFSGVGGIYGSNLDRNDDLYSKDAGSSSTGDTDSSPSFRRPADVCIPRWRSGPPAEAGQFLSSEPN